jgi:hypothetical protein
MDKWILLVTFGTTMHVVDILESKPQCTEMMVAVNKQLLRSDRIEFLSHCIHYEDFIHSDTSKVYTLR